MNPIAAVHLGGVSNGGSRLAARVLASLDPALAGHAPRF